ncbi:tumor necrosis factor receptor superfamily member 5 [Ctenodactylus gundi]
MVRLPLQCVLWGCLLTPVHSDSITCEANQYQLNNQCCNLCPPGEKLVNDCTELTDTECRSCNSGEFLRTWNRERHCHSHTYCDPLLGLQVQREGTLITDTICTCVEGRHCTGDACEHCDLHTSCGPGFGVKQMATGTADTICEPCPNGFFSNVSSAFAKCQPWTSCKTNNLVELQAGTNVADVLCGKSCRMGPGFQHRRRALVAIPVILGILVAICLTSVYIRKVIRKPKGKTPDHENKQDPVEMEYLPGHNPAAPVQETLHGCQPVTQEDGKESRISVQERQ